MLIHMHMYIYFIIYNCSHDYSLHHLFTLFIIVHLFIHLTLYTEALCCDSEGSYPLPLLGISFSLSLAFTPFLWPYILL